MYAKIFESIYDGSLRKDWKALVTFQQLLVLCDEEGYVDKTPDAISSRTTIPIEIIEHGLNELSSADPDSRSRDEDGRRIVLIAPPRKWGWRIVNYQSYRDIRSKEELRSYWKGQKREQRQSESADRTMQLRKLLCVAFRRPEVDRWSYVEESSLCEVSKRENCLIEFNELIAFRSKRGKFFPQSVVRMLENWGQTLDMARNGHSLTESPSLMMKALQEEIDSHPANRESAYYQPSCTDVQKNQLKQLRDKYRTVRSQIANG
jgi:hypothetical protein